MKSNKSLKEQAQVMLEASEGGQIQLLSINGKDWMDVNIKSHGNFNWQEYDYRIKPPSTLIKPLDLPPLCFIHRESDPNGDITMVTAFTRNHITVNNKIFSLEYLHEAGYKWSTDKKNWQSFDTKFIL